VVDRSVCMFQAARLCLAPVDRAGIAISSATDALRATTRRPTTSTVAVSIPNGQFDAAVDESDFQPDCLTGSRFRQQTAASNSLYDKAAKLNICAMS